MEKLSLQFQQHFDASPADVFHAWSDAEAMLQWLVASDDMTTTIHHVDFRVGGTFKFDMKEANGTNHVTDGEYKEIVPDEKIVIVWTCGETHDASLVTVELKPNGSGTDFTLTDQDFESEESMKSHNEGWKGILAHLQKFLA
ncbi:MAG: ATPase [Candidatus Peribacteria bacterium]|nr:ATPase [Candidatus Peribacteria bacterium]